MLKQTNAIPIKANVIINQVGEKYRLTFNLTIGNETKTEEQEFLTFEETWGFAQGLIVSALKNFKEAIPVNYEWKLEYQGITNEDS